MIKVIIWGIGGKMGKTVLECVNLDNEIQVVAGVDQFANQNDFKMPIFNDTKSVNVKADVIIDFSRPDALDDILEYALKNNCKAVLCTTGYNQEQLSKIKQASKQISIFQSANMSLGVNLLIDLCKKASNFLSDKYDIEIIEQHHNLKVDSPSGTALTIADEINKQFDNQKNYVFGRHDKNCRRTPQEIGIHAVRGGTIVGKHDVQFIGNDEIITIAHEAQSKAVFANGAIKAAKFLSSCQSGMYDMKDMIAKIID